MNGNEKTSRHTVKLKKVNRVISMVSHIKNNSKKQPYRTKLYTPHIQYILHTHTHTHIYRGIKPQITWVPSGKGSEMAGWRDSDLCLLFYIRLCYLNILWAYLHVLRGRLRRGVGKKIKGSRTLEFYFQFNHLFCCVIDLQIILLKKKVKNNTYGIITFLMFMCIYVCM